MVLTTTEVEKMHEKEKKIVKKEEDMTEEEWVEFKLKQWRYGDMFITDYDKGNLITMLFRRIKKLEDKSK